MNAFLLEAIAELAAAKGLDPDCARAHMAATLAQMDLPKTTYLEREHARLLIWTKMYR